MVISLHSLILSNYAESMGFYWSSMMLVFYLLSNKFLHIFVLIEFCLHFLLSRLMGHLFVVRMVVVQLSCLNVKRTLI